MDKITQLNYVWVDTNTNKVLSRYQTQKNRLVELNLGTEEQTGDAIMEALGYLKIYNSGNIKLTWTNESSN